MKALPKRKGNELTKCADHVDGVASMKALPKRKGNSVAGVLFDVVNVPQ